MCLNTKKAQRWKHGHIIEMSIDEDVNCCFLPDSQIISMVVAHIQD
jgi:hypothetical protein